MYGFARLIALEGEERRARIVITALLAAVIATTDRPVR